jgi:HEAT repeat protein
VLGAGEAEAPLAQRLARAREAASAEEIWAYGEIAAKDPESQGSAAALLGSFVAADPAAELVRTAARVKVGHDAGVVGEALVAALATPGHRKVDTSRQRIWAWRTFGELGEITPDLDTIRAFVTTDDHGVRAAAARALARQNVEMPRTRPYFLFVLDELEATGGLAALHDAVADPWGLFRYNVALRLARLGHPSSVPVLCEALRALFLEPPTSTYEYDDPPYHIRWFARALRSFDDERAAACLIEGLSSPNHHVRQIVASDPPKDDRVVPALVRLLDDPRALLRSRAQHALESFKKTVAYARAMEERDHIAEA